MQSTKLSARARAARHPIVHDGPRDFFSGPCSATAVSVPWCAPGRRNRGPVRAQRRLGHQALGARHRPDRDLPRDLRPGANDTGRPPANRPGPVVQGLRRCHDRELLPALAPAFPCGTLLVGFDRRRVELLGHRLDVATGLCTVELLVAGRRPRSRSSSSWRRIDCGRCSATSTGRRGLPIRPGRRHAGSGWLAKDGTHEVPGPEIPDPLPDRCLAFRQVLPARAPPEGPGPDPADRAFRLSAFVDLAMERRSSRAGTAAERRWHPWSGRYPRTGHSWRASSSSTDRQRACPRSPVTLHR